MMEKDLLLRRQRRSGRSFAFAAINFAALCAEKMQLRVWEKKEIAEPAEKREAAK